MAAAKMSEQDFKAIKMYIFLPLILSAFERDYKLLKSAGILKTPSLYLDAIRQAQDRVSADFKDVKDYMRTNGIKVYEQTRTDKGIDVFYMCRGYHGSEGYLWDLIRSESIVLMYKYMGLDFVAIKNK